MVACFTKEVGFMLESIVGGIVAFGLLIYLVYALVKAEEL